MNGLACAIEAERDGRWLVTIAGVSVSRRDDLVAAIVDASGGVIGADDAEAVATRVCERPPG